MPQPDPHLSHSPTENTRAPYILVVDDEPDIRTLLQEILVDEGYEVDIAEDGHHARQAHRARSLACSFLTTPGDWLACHE